MSVGRVLLHCPCAGKEGGREGGRERGEGGGGGGGEERRKGWRERERKEGLRRGSSQPQVGRGMAGLRGGDWLELAQWAEVRGGFTH